MTVNNMQESDNWLGIRLKEAADSVGLTSEEIAKRMNKSGAAIRFWWLGRRKISIEDLKTYAAITDYPLDYFLHKEYHLPDSESIRKKLDKLAQEVEELRKVTEAPPGFRIAQTSWGEDVCVPIDSDVDQETIDAIGELQNRGVKSVSEQKHA
ncbi:MAG: helix-turn-helix domain-containing protein [Armatimonadota bacterium]